MKGKNPFSNWQQANQERREAYIRPLLVYLKKKRMRFEYITDLADMVAIHISEQEGKPCNCATLLRNKRYKSLLVSYMASTSSGGTDAIDRRIVKDPTANALVLAAEVGAENLRREVVRLKAYIATFDEGASSAIKEENNGKTVATPSSLEDLRLRHVLTCQALLAVLKHFEGLLLADSDANSIIDASARPPFVVAGASLAGPFFEWMHLNREVGGRRE
ncbi:hypothetical protein [Variovorax sp. GT1P44]|uniref:hypothetical protein n=1 Tax=Variovorax sp. GT1P44 TaxID=3443742 RepID=UPI003F473D72